MNKLIFLIVFVVLSFFAFHKVDAVSISAIPQEKIFGPNDWIKINITVNEYNGGPVKWSAQRPDNSIISGALDVLRDGYGVHQIIRDASDNEFGIWKINYTYAGVSKPIIFKVNSLFLRAITDKNLYYEPDTMKLNITTAYYNPNAKFAEPYHLKFYDKNGNLANVRDIEIKATQPNIQYNFPLSELSRYNPPGLYKLKIQYFNSFFGIPFLLGDINKLMEIGVTNSATYYQGDNFTLDLIFTRVKESTGVLKIIEPTGNFTDRQFGVDSIHTVLSLENITNSIGDYKFEVQYAGITQEGSFKVIPNSHPTPNIKLDLFLNKFNYNRGEKVEAKVYTSEVINNTIRMWVVDPQGTTHHELSIPVFSNNIVFPYKIKKDDLVGLWNFYIDYSGVIKSSTFYVTSSSQNEISSSIPLNIPALVSIMNITLNSPQGIALDKEENIYVVNTGNSSIAKYDHNDTLLFSWGSPGSSNGQFKNPTGIYVNEKYVYVADTGNSRIEMFDKSGKFVYAWGGYGTDHGMFHSPTSISADESGNLFVADSDRSVIQIFDNYGKYVDEIHPVLVEGGSFNGIKSIVFDSANNFYSATTDNKILKYSDIGKFINFYGSGGTEQSRFDNPSAIVIDSNNYVYVADTGNHRIQKFDSDGNFMTEWGNDSNVTKLQEPVALAIDSSDNIFVVDKKDNNIKKFALHQESNEMIFPSWVKNNAGWWSESALDKKDFSTSIRYLVNHGLIHAPLVTGSDSDIENMQKIPTWVKSNAAMWYSNQIDDRTFASSIEYLLSSGIMKI